MGRSIAERRRRHVARRARERWGVWLESPDIGMLNVVVRAGLGRQIGSPKKRARKVWVTTLSGDRLPVVFCEKKNMVVTVLPPTSREVARYLASKQGT